MLKFNLILFLILNTVFAISVNAEDKIEEKEFKNWISKQNQDFVNSYIEYVSSSLDDDINPIDIFIDRHDDAEECKKELFVLPPKNLWRQIVSPLRLLQKLISLEIIDDYTILSTFRTEEANSCMNGAKHSKHIYNAAVDFKINSDLDKTEKELCKFWRKYGKKYNMGFGAYGEGYYHIDRGGYRTWGANYSGNSSVCK